MSSSRPEAMSQYSRATAASGSGADAHRGADRGRSRGARTAVVLGGLAGAGLLIAAELSPLLTIQTGPDAPVIETISTGIHNSFALVPLALLAGALAVAAGRSGRRFPLVAIVALGLVALGIALLGDLPGVDAGGVIRERSGWLVSAASRPAAGFYLEVLGAVVLLLGAAAGLLLAPRRRSGRRTRRPSGRGRSAS